MRCLSKALGLWTRTANAWDSLQIVHFRLPEIVFVATCPSPVEEHSSAVSIDADGREHSPKWGSFVSYRVSDGESKVISRVFNCL